MRLPPAKLSDEVVDLIRDQRTRFAAAVGILQRGVDEHAFPGAAFGVLLDGKIIAIDAVGRFTYDSGSPAITPATIYDLASVTKVAATTAAAMLLYDHGQLDLEQPFDDLLPGFVVQTAREWATSAALARQRRRVTLRTLLAHSSGLPAYARLFERNATPAALLAACLQMPLEAEPGLRAEYSDIGFILLGKALEIIAGEDLDTFCDREIFTPLAMDSTCYRPPSGWHALIPPTEADTGFRHRVIQGEVQDENCFVLGGVGGNAGLFSSVHDLLVFAACILSEGGLPSGNRLFSAATMALFASRQAPAGSSRALGWDTPSADSSSGGHFSRSSIGHLGYAGTSLWIDLEHRFAVVLLTNRTWPDRSNQAIRAVRPAFHDAVVAGLTFS